MALRIFLFLLSSSILTLLLIRELILRYSKRHQLSSKELAVLQFIKEGRTIGDISVSLNINLFKAFFIVRCSLLYYVDFLSLNREGYDPKDVFYSPNYYGILKLTQLKSE